MFLLDANVVSELRKTRTGKADKQVVRWGESVDPASLYLSTVTIHELEMGVLQVERRDRTQSQLLRVSLNDQVLPSFAERILPVDTAVALRCAQLHVPDPRPDRDALIAATALVHAMTVVIRNTVDFGATGVELINPWRPA